MKEMIGKDAGIEDVNEGKTKHEVKRCRKFWTIESIKKLMMLYKIYGSKWSMIAAKFPGMSENDIKNKFYSCLKSVSSKFQNQYPTLPKYKQELVRFVDVVIIYGETLLCKRNSKRNKNKRSKQEIASVSTSKEPSVENSQTGLILSFWLNNSTLEKDTFSGAMSQMIWNNSGTGNNLINHGTAKTNGSTSKEGFISKS